MRDRTVILGGGAAIAALMALTRFSPPAPYVAMAATVLLSGALVGHAVGLSPRRLSVASVWYVSYLVGTAIPACFVAADQDTVYVGPFLFAVIATLFTAPAGMLLVNLATGFRREEVGGFFRAPVVRDGASASETGTFLLFLGLCLALTAGYLIETPVIPLLYLIQHPGSAVVLVTLREESFKLLDSPFVYAYDVIRNVGYPFLVCVSLGRWLQHRTGTWLFLFLLTTVVGLLYAAISIAKAPVAVIILVMVLFVYLYRRGRMKLRAVLIGLGAVFLFPLVVLFRSLSGLGVSAGDIGLALLRRLFYLPAEILYNYFVVVPDVVPYLHGRSIGRVQWILGESGFDLGNFVFRFMYPQRIDSGVANTSFLGYLHADFGVPGVLLGGIVVGLLVQGLQVWLVRRPKSVTTLAAYAFLLWAAWKVNFQALPQTLLSGGVIVILVLVRLFRLTDSFFRVATAEPGRTVTSP